MIYSHGTCANCLGSKITLKRRTIRRFISQKIEELSRSISFNSFQNQPKNMNSRFIFQIFAILFILNLISLTNSLRTTQSGKAKYCGKRLEHWRDRVCKWPGESQPCLQLHHSAKERIATKCCQNGCELEDIKEACCFTQACLNRCYPGKGYRVGSVYK